MNLDRPFKNDEIAGIQNQHDRWKTELPSMEVMAGFAIHIGPPPPVEPPQQMVQFKSYKRDGSPEWLMQFRENWFSVNCLQYSRWNDIWRQAQTLISRAIGCIDLTNNPIVGYGIEYVDAFVWEAPSYPDVSTLLKRDSKYIPTAIWDGRLGHLNHGAFRDTDQGELLEIVNLAIQLNAGQHRIVVSNPLRLKLPDRIDSWSSDSEKAMAVVFEFLHQTNKSFLLDLLLPPVCESISLARTP